MNASRAARWMAGVLVLSCVGVAAAQPLALKHVLVLHEFGPDTPSRAAFDPAILQALRSASAGPIDVSIETLESYRFPAAMRSGLTAEYLKAKYRERKIDVVVAVQAVAATFARENRDVFGHAPIVAFAPKALFGPDDDDITGIQTDFVIRDTLGLGLALEPDTEHVFVIDGALQNSDSIEAEFHRQAATLDRRVDLVYLRDLAMIDLLDRLKTIPGRSIVIYVKQTMWDRSTSISQREGLSQVARVSPVPIFTLVSESIGSGPVGGYLWQAKVDAARLADMAVRIANGARPHDLAPRDATVAPTVDWQQLQRWQIPESRLPAGSIVLFRPESFFQTYQRWIVAVIALVIIQSVMIATLWIQRTKMRESEARNLAILRAAPDLMFLQTRDGVYLDYYAPERDRLLMPPERFIGRNMRDVLPPELLERIMPLFTRVWETEQTVVGEYSAEVGGARRRYEARLVRCGEDKVLSVIRDETERNRTAAALLNSEQRYALATTAGRVGVWDWNLETDDIYVDPRLKAILGFEDGEIPNRLADWRQRVYRDDLPLVKARAESHINGVTPAYEAEYRMVHKDGRILWFAARGSAVHEGGRPVRLVGTDTDITERRRSDEALQQAQADLDRMSRLAAFGEFTASIAHEVSQPLTVIMLNARACLRELADPSADIHEVRTALSEVVDAGKLAEGIIRRNRDLFRRQIVQKHRLNMNDVIQDVAVLVSSRLAAHQVKLELHLASSLPPILGDRVELCQLLSNLIINAIDATSSVDVQSRVVSVTSDSTPGREVQVSIRDTGVGFAAADADRIFTTGFTTKPEGTGVGLSVCRTITEAHGGRLWARLNDGAGATFSFTVPVAVASGGDERLISRVPAAISDSPVS